MTEKKMGRIEALGKFWPYMKPHLGAITISLLLSIPMAAVKISPAPAVKYLTDNILVNKNETALFWLPFGIVAVFAVNFIIRFLHFYLIRAASTSVIQTLRNEVYSHLLKLSMGYFGEAQAGMLLSQVINDVQNIVRALSSIVNLVREPIIFLCLMGYALYLNWSLALLTLIITPLVALLLGNTGKHAKRYSAKILERMGDLSSLLVESFAGMRVIQAFGLEAYMRGQFMRRNRDLTRTSLKAIRVEEMSHPGIELISGIAIALVLYYGGKEVLAGKMTTGDVFAFFTSFGLMVQPLRTFNELNITFHQCAAAAENIFKILNLSPEVMDAPTATKLANFQNAIEFQGVDFQYNESRKILRNFSLKIKKGEIIALVGASGAGKTTVLSMIPRFFDPQNGKILIDDIDIRSVTLQSLREQIALVTQEVFLFHDTIRSNIKAGRHSISDEKMIEAAKAAQAYDYIQRLPQKWDTVIGDRGQKLSGGERQRLSIARAILKDAPILLLDEATSALDSENERLVQAALDRLLVGRTAIVVAHRLSTIRKADRIVVMENGVILEEGSHEELITRKGAYAKALSLQEGFSA